MKRKVIIKISSAVGIVWSVYFMVKDIITYRLYEPFGLIFILLISTLFALGVGIDSVKDNAKLNRFIGNTMIGLLLLSCLILVYILVRLTLINLPLMIVWAIANYLLLLL